MLPSVVTEILRLVECPSARKARDDYSTPKSYLHVLDGLIGARKIGKKSVPVPDYLTSAPYLDNRLEP